MIEMKPFYDGTILNLSGVVANQQYVMKCTWLQRYEANKVRKVWDLPTDRPLTHTELVTRASEFVQQVLAEHPEVGAVWIRPMKSAPFFYTYLEDMFLSNGVAIAIPAEEYDQSVSGSHKFRMDGWWVVPPFTEEELEG